MICLGEFPAKSLEAEAEPIATCLEFIRFPNSERRALLSLFSSDIAFDPVRVAELGWVGVEAETDGQLTDDEEDLLAELIGNLPVDQVFASSRRDILNSNGDYFMGCRICGFSSRHLTALRCGFWTMSKWAAVLEGVGLNWVNWRELFIFTWPLKFALVHLREGFGRTTLIGPPDLIDEFQARRQEGETHEWHPWGVRGV